MSQPDFTALGPQPGRPFPDVVLPAQDGRPVDLHADRAGRPAVVVFYRSARW
jgi:peroxiredoxin